MWKATFLTAFNFNWRLGDSINLFLVSFSHFPQVFKSLRKVPDISDLIFPSLVSFAFLKSFLFPLLLLNIKTRCFLITRVPFSLGLLALK